MICTNSPICIYYAEIPKTENGKDIKKPFCDFENKFLGYISDCKCKRTSREVNNEKD